MFSKRNPVVRRRDFTKYCDMSNHVHAHTRTWDRHCGTGFLNKGHKIRLLCLVFTFTNWKNTSYVCMYVYSDPHPHKQRKQFRNNTV